MFFIQKVPDLWGEGADGCKFHFHGRVQWALLFIFTFQIPSCHQKTKLKTPPPWRDSTLTQKPPPPPSLMQKPPPPLSLRSASLPQIRLTRTTKGGSGGPGEGLAGRRGSKGRTVLVSLRADTESQALLTWVLVNVAAAWDHVMLAVHSEYRREYHLHLFWI
jgi:hypothetical protein